MEQIVGLVRRHSCLFGEAITFTALSASPPQRSPLKRAVSADLGQQMSES